MEDKLIRLDTTDNGCQGRIDAMKKAASPHQYRLRLPSTANCHALDMNSRDLNACPCPRQVVSHGKRVTVASEDNHFVRYSHAHLVASGRNEHPEVGLASERAV
jgi:hypothetical protein